MISFHISKQLGAVGFAYKYAILLCNLWTEIMKNCENEFRNVVLH